jgi:Concanavalin A-like lectin/glucanases superfamily
VLTLQAPTSAFQARDRGWFLYGSDTRLQRDNGGTLGNGSWRYIVGTYDTDAGPNNQRLYLNGARVAQMSDARPIDLNSNPSASGGM